MLRLLGLLFLFTSVGCATGSGGAEGGGTSAAGGGDQGGGAATTGTGGAGQGGGFMAGSGGGGPLGVPEVFGHSGTTLYKLNPETKAVSIVGPFGGCPSIVDIALDKDSNLYGTAYTGLYAIDRTDAQCTLIAAGTYPDSLSFIPAGLLDPTEEVLVGFLDDQYVRIDPQTGQVTNVGTPWNNGFQSSGDVVSVKDGPTYLTIKDIAASGTTCRDCLVRINPTTGAILDDYGSVGYVDVFGTAFWAGQVYGFTKAGELFEISVTGTSIQTTSIPTSAGLVFYGAGSTTSAPPVPE